MSTDPRSEPDDCDCLAMRQAERQILSTPGAVAGEITPPWAPIARLPALDHAVIVMGRNVEMHEVYSSVCSFRGEGEDQGRIRINVVPNQICPGAGWAL